MKFLMFAMKSHLFVGMFVSLFLASGALTDYVNFLKAASKTCADELKIPDEAIKKFYNGGRSPADATPAIRCHIKCTLEKRGTLKNGKHILEAYDKELSSYPEMKDFKAGLLKTATECTNVGGPNACEESYNYFVCFYKSEIMKKVLAYYSTKQK